jgi:hypothetical protein
MRNLVSNYSDAHPTQAGSGKNGSCKAVPSYSGGPTLTTKYEAGSVLLALVM